MSLSNLVGSIVDLITVIQKSAARAEAEIKYKLQVLRKNTALFTIQLGCYSAALGFIFTAIILFMQRYLPADITFAIISVLLLIVSWILKNKETKI